MSGVPLNIFISIRKKLHHNISIVTALVVLISVITVPGFQTIFKFEFPGFYHYIPSFIGAAVLPATLEISKVVMLRKKSQNEGLSQTQHDKT